MAIVDHGHEEKGYKDAVSSFAVSDQQTGIFAARHYGNMISDMEVIGNRSPAAQNC